MPEPRRLRNPPITEAIIDIRVETDVGFDVALLRAAETMLADSYGLEAEQHQVRGTLEVAGDQPMTLEQGEPALAGYTFRSRDERFVVQFTVEGLTLSQLRGYTAWEDLAAEAARLWDVYSGLAHPRRILRIGTRYLNTIAIVPPGADPNAYFTTLPAVPEGVRVAAGSFLVRMVLHEEEPPFSASVTQFLERADEGAVRLILDIDAFSRETYAVDASIIWGALAGLRDLKNRVFFGSVTEKTLGLFQ